MLRVCSSLVVLGICLLFTPIVSAQQSPFSSCADGTGSVENATIVVPTSSNPNINGTALSADSEIAVFDDAGSFCAGVATWNGSSNVSITVWGDPDGVNGLSDGESMSFQVWDHDSDTSYDDDISVSYLSLPGYSTDGIYGDGKLFAFSDLTITAAGSPPSAPTLDSPGNDATSVSTSLTLDWNAVSDANSYRVQLATNSGFSSPIVDKNNLSQTQHSVSSLNYSTVYYWRVRAKNANGNSTWSDTWSFTTDDPPIAPPASPTLDSPEDDATSVSRDIALAWNSVSTAISYHLQVASNEGFSTLIANENDLTNTSYDGADLDYSTTYYWRVRASNAGGTSGWSAVWSFSTEDETIAPPAAPTLDSPEDDATSMPRDTPLGWNSVSGADSYHLQVATDDGFSSLIVDEDDQSGTNYDDTSFDYSEVYFWRVKASNAGGTSDWSSTWSFTVQDEPATQPTVPTLDTPENEAVNVSRNPRIEWNSVENAESYRIQVSTKDDFSNLILDDDDLADTRFDLTDLDFATTYYWRVKASNAGGTSEWSDTWYFTTENDPTAVPRAPVLESPEDDAEDVSTSPTLRWKEVSGANSFKIQVASDEGFSNILLEVDSLSDPEHDLADLAYTTAYFWRVQANNGNGDSEWSAIWRFTTQSPGGSVPERPSTDHHSDGETNVSVAPTLTWNAVSGADIYHLQLAVDPIFAEIVVNVEDLSQTHFDLSGLDYATSYFWRVRASNATGISSWSDVLRFTTETQTSTQLTTPILASPRDGAENVTVPVMLVWEVVPQAAYYQIQVSKETGDGSSVVVFDSLGVFGTSLRDIVLEEDVLHTWRVKAFSDDGNSAWSSRSSFTTESVTNTAFEEDAELPSRSQLLPNYPNPFHRQTTLSFELSETTVTKITIYNLLGKAITTLVNETLSAGKHEIIWNADNAPSGIYLCRMQAGTTTLTRKLTVMK